MPVQKKVLKLIECTTYMYIHIYVCLYIYIYMCVCVRLQLDAFVREHVWHKVKLMGIQ